MSLSMLGRGLLVPVSAKNMLPPYRNEFLLPRAMKEISPKTASDLSRAELSVYILSLHNNIRERLPVFQLRVGPPYTVCLSVEYKISIKN